MVTSRQISGPAISGKRLVSVLLGTVLFALFLFYFFHNSAPQSLLGLNEQCSGVGETLNLLVPKNRAQSADCSPVIASIAGRTITEAEFKAYMQRRSGGYIDQFSTLEQKQNLLQELIDHELQVARALQAGFDRDPEVVAMLERIMVGKLREQQLDRMLSAIVVSDDEIHRYYQSHLAEFSQPARVRGAIIHLELGSMASAEKRSAVKTKADEILGLARSLPASVQDFGTLAARHSDDQASRYQGGDVGWVVQDGAARSGDPAVLRALMSLERSGDLAPVIEGADGYYLVKLTDKKPAQAMTLATQSKKIRVQLLHQKRARVRADWLDSLRGDDTLVEVDQELLQSLPSPAGRLVRKVEVRPPRLPDG